MQKSTTQLFVGAAIAGMIGAAATMTISTPAYAKGKKVHCYGVNECGGKGACATTGQNDCKGKNSCKGKGFLELSKAECKKKGGSTEAPKS